jgi:hypothetical protein
LNEANLLEMSAGGRRSVTYALVALVILITALFAYYYLESQTTLSQKDQQITSLESALGIQKLNATKLQVEGAKLNVSIANLVAEISSLRTNQSASQLRISQLEMQLGNYRNESALDSVELGIVYQVKGISVSPLFLNTTLTVAPDATVTNAAGSGGGNWTLVFLSPKGCPIQGIGQTQAQSNTIIIFLNSTWPAITFDAAPIGPQPFTLQFQNVGDSSVECYFSIYTVNYA